MLSHNELKKGVIFIYKGQPHQVLEHSLLFKGRGSSKMQVKIKNLATGGVLSQTFHAGDSFEPAELARKALKFVYSQPVRGIASRAAGGANYVFCEAENPSKRTELTGEEVGPGGEFLKAGQLVDGLLFDNKIIGISLPIKVSLRVKEAPPGIRAGRAESGTKQVILETGAQINTPLFVKQGDLVEVNTETGEYVRRVE